jgi:osmotically-inducible protein OsmY
MHFKLLIGFSISTLFFAGAVRAQIHIPNSQVIAEIEDHLYHASVLTHGKVQVTYAEGVATLTGTVDSVGVKTDAEKATWRDEDVQRVVNQIAVGSAGTDSAQILKEARRKIRTYYANTIFDDIELEAQGNTLVVRGTVTQPYKKDAIGNFLTHIKGVAALENKTQVLPLSVDDEDLRARIARAIYDDPYFGSYVEAANPTIHIIVNSGNVTLVGTVSSALDRSRAEQDARLVNSISPVQNNLRVEGQGATQ